VNDVLGWGLLGTARIARSILPHLSTGGRHRVVAVASREAARAHVFAAEWGIPTAHGSYEALLADPEVDVVYNPLPNALHVPWTLAAIRHGKHVLCEKPLALAVGEVDEVARAAREAGVVVSEGFMYRHHPQTWRVKDLVAAGALGAVALVRGAFTFTLTRARDARLDPALGGGSLWDVGCYPVSYARFVLDAEPVEATGAWRLGASGVDEAFAGTLRFSSGALAPFDCGFRAHLRTSIEVVGTDAVLVVEHPFKPGAVERLTIRRGDRAETIEVGGPLPYAAEVDDMADAALGRRPARVGLDESRGNAAALVALADSARLGRPVAVAR
jgi:predicted dehydrogenase